MKAQLKMIVENNFETLNSYQEFLLCHSHTDILNSELILFYSFCGSHVDQWSISRVRSTESVCGHVD